MKAERNRSFSFTRRALILGGGQILLFGGLAARMYQLQVVEAERYRVLADENRINLRLLAPPRGRILDRHQQVIADTQQVYRALLTAERAGDLEQTLDRLRLLLNLSPEELKRVRTDIKRNRQYVPVTVRDNLDWDQVARLEVNSLALPGVQVEVGQTRHYPYGGSAVHILGYVGAVSEKERNGDPLLDLPGFQIGKTGLERHYEAGLRGSAGATEIEVNAGGRIIRELSRHDGQPGTDLSVKLDMALQQFAQQRLSAELSGAAVLMNVDDGAVLALASTPTFDPNAFALGIRASDWRALNNDPLRPQTNKALAGQYAPGSTFKMMVALAALKQGIDADTAISCGGHVSLGNARFHCWKREGHGTLRMADALKHSCDVYFYELARRVGIDAIAAMSRKFGLGSLTGIDLPGEKGGLIPDRKWKRAALNQPWHPGEDLVAGIGQGYITTTPLQLTLMTARIANGGRAVVPHLVGVVPYAAPLDVDQAHLDVVIEGMNRVTNEPGGTAFGSRITQIGQEMAGKTGTAQVRRITLSERASGVIKNEALPWTQRDHALFVGFAPLHAPRYAVAVVVEHGGGGSKVAAPIARDILIEAQRLDALQPGAKANVPAPEPV